MQTSRRKTSTSSLTREDVLSHFSRYFAMEFYSGKAELLPAQKLRHDVYCTELGWEPTTKEGIEVDEFDDWSPHCAIRHKASGKIAGCVRMVSPSNHQQFLPIENAGGAIQLEQRQPADFPKSTLIEISRLAIHEDFRKRKGEDTAADAIGSKMCDEESRTVSYISLALYMAALAYALKTGRQNCFVVMEPRLQRHMLSFGIPAEKVGPMGNHHGRRAPFYINANDMFHGIKPFTKALLVDMMFQLERYMSHEVDKAS